MTSRSPTTTLDIRISERQRELIAFVLERHLDVVFVSDEAMQELTRLTEMFADKEQLLQETGINDLSPI